MSLLLPRIRLVQYSELTFRVGNVVSSLSVKNGTRYNHTICGLVPFQMTPNPIYIYIYTAQYRKNYKKTTKRTLPPVGSVAGVESNESSHSCESMIITVELIGLQ